MRYSRRSSLRSDAILAVLVAVASIALGGCVSGSATSVPLATDESATASAARRLMTRARYCALVTIGEDGQPQARAIDPSPPDERFVIWFVTPPTIRKARQIARDPRVTLYYFDEQAPGYVTVVGVARKIDSHEEKQQRWLEKWTPFYPGGADGALLYQVTPRRIEVVDVSSGVVSDQPSWEPPSIEIKE